MAASRSKLYTRSHNYTISPYAYGGLTALFCRTTTTTYTNSDGLSITETKPILQSRSTAFQHRPSFAYNEFADPTSSVNGVYQDSDTDTSSHYEGLSHALIQVCRNYDYDNWTPQPVVTGLGTLDKPLWYKPIDRPYIEENLLDLQDDPESFTPRRIEDLKREISYDYSYNHNNRNKSGYGRYALSLPNDIRHYLVGLLQFHSVSACPIRRHSDNLTSKVSWALEVIGSQHLTPDEKLIRFSGIGLKENAQLVTLRQLVAEPNPRKVRANRQAGARRKYGNHNHDSQLPRKWRPLPTVANYQKWTTEDLEWARSNGLADLAKEVSVLLGLEAPSTLISNPTPAVLELTELPDRLQVSASSSASQQPIYTYKKRDITEPVLLAYEQHYLTDPPVSFPKLEPLAEEWGLKLYVLRSLATKEYVRRQLDPEANIRGTTSPIPKRRSKPQRMEALQS